jgi:hypothetical protein
MGDVPELSDAIGDGANLFRRRALVHRDDHGLWVPASAIVRGEMPRTPRSQGGAA